MPHDERPWLRFYDEGVEADLPIPDSTYVEMLEESFSDFPNRAAVHLLGTTLTFHELDMYSRRFANFLAEIGCGPGDVVGINLPNLPQYLTALAGTLRAGCIATGVSPLLMPRETAYQLNDCGARVLVTLDAIFEQKVLPLAGQVPELDHIVATSYADLLRPFDGDRSGLLESAPTGKVFPISGKTVLSFPELLDKYPAKLPRVEAKPGDTCLIQYTGGTTGMPKGAELSHANLVANIVHRDQWNGNEPGRETNITGYPLFHVAGVSYGMGAMCTGNTQILIPDARNIRHFCEEFERHTPTLMTNVPSLYQMLLDDPMFRTLEFSQLRVCISGAAPIPVESFRALEDLVGANKLVEVYGMTETSPLLTMNPLRGLKKIGTVGIPIQNTRLKLVDLDTGNSEVPFGEEGEIIARGPQVMKGYYGKPEETAHALREFHGEKWLYTGDVGKMDEDGYLTIVDRTKDMINVSGYKVFSKEVETTLYENPDIEFCAVVGVPDPDRSGRMLVKAMIQLRADCTDKDEIGKEIAHHCQENMAPYKRPKIIEFVDELPLTSVGKVDKKALR
jgi:acyl-CoA synthetase (AMP-forming)/AMP-acid ligase II